MIERVTQQVAQSDKHSHRCLILVVAHQTNNAVQRVEEKVWVQLHSQRLELRLCKLRFESRRQKLALAILAIVVECITDPDHATVNQQIRAKRSFQAREENRPEICGALTHVVERLDGQVDYGGGGAMNGGDQEKRRQVNGETTQPRLTNEGKLPGQPNYDGSQRRPGQPRKDLPAKDSPRRMAHPFGFDLVVDGPGIDQPEQRPERNDDPPRLQIRPIGHRTYTIQPLLWYSM